MADYDCDCCNKNVNAGGKCDKFEYDCPFSHLEYNNEKEKQDVDSDLKNAKILYNNLNSALKDFEKNIKRNYVYSEIIQNLKFTMSNLEDMVDDKLIEEWKEINK